MSVAPSSGPVRASTATEVVAGYLAAASIFVALIGIVYRPVRLIPAAILLALIAVCMGPRSRSLGIAAVAIAGGSFIVGMTVTVLTGHPLW